MQGQLAGQLLDENMKMAAWGRVPRTAAGYNRIGNVSERQNAHASETYMN